MGGELEMERFRGGDVVIEPDMDEGSFAIVVDLSLTLISLTWEYLGGVESSPTGELLSSWRDVEGSALGVESFSSRLSREYGGVESAGGGVSSLKSNGDFSGDAITMISFF